MYSAKAERLQPRDQQSKKKIGQIWRQLKEDSQKLVKDLEKSLQNTSQQSRDHGYRGINHPPEASLLDGHSNLPSREVHAQAPSYGMDHTSGSQAWQLQDSFAQQHQQAFPSMSSGFQQHSQFHPDNEPRHPQHQLEYLAASNQPLLNGPNYSAGSQTKLNAFSPMSNQTRIPQQSESFLGHSSWVAPPDQGYRTAKLREALAAAYGLQSQLVQTALDFAETEEFADLYCFAYCLTGGPMKDAFAQATMHSFSKGNLLESFADARKGPADKLLTAEQQKIKQAVIDKWQEEQQVEYADTEALEEDEVERLREEVKGLSAEDALKLLGVTGPGYGLRDVQRDLFPGNGISTRTKEENARRSAAYTVAMEVLEM